MSLVRDCSWRRLTSICVRNLPCELSELTLQVISHSGEKTLELRHFSSSHPSWEQLEISSYAFPATFNILNESLDSVFESRIDMRNMYYISSSLEEIEDFSFLACLFEIDNEIYTNAEYFQALEKVSINSSTQIKYKVLQTIPPKKVNSMQIKFHEIQAKYLQ